MYELAETTPACVGHVLQLDHALGCGLWVWPRGVPAIIKSLEKTVVPRLANASIPLKIVQYPVHVCAGATPTADEEAEGHRERVGGVAEHAGAAAAGGEPDAACRRGELLTE
eukprot:CAMPEP_0170251118 /NCGR_PEP_ID=MMETSP0116_2-20130129/25388_1 /TAXON_ID=400756 /ORGANISM="Durinskia baltica, Strain CSIRO CS-38" /LENGTH=111 /DNA_ID=CAMNT_0010502079 /DNA_START=344 /DNA_END=675 /DNA_ORIENTATION=+